MLVWVFAVIFVRVAKGLDPDCDTAACEYYEQKLDGCETDYQNLKNITSLITAGTNLIGYPLGMKMAITVDGDFNFFFCPSSTVQILLAVYLPQSSKLDTCSYGDDRTTCGCIDVIQSPVIAACNGKPLCGVTVVNSVFNPEESCEDMEIRVIYKCKTPPSGSFPWLY